MSMKFLWKYFMMLFLISNSHYFDNSEQCGKEEGQHAVMGKQLWKGNQQT